MTGTQLDALSSGGMNLLAPSSFLQLKLPKCHPTEFSSDNTSLQVLLLIDNSVDLLYGCTTKLFCFAYVMWLIYLFTPLLFGG